MDDDASRAVDGPAPRDLLAESTATAWLRGPSPYHARMPVSLAEMAAHLRRRQQQQLELARVRAARFMALLPQAKAMLIDRYGAAQVWLFGSLARGDSTVASDVDLAVDGLPSACYFAALAELMALLGGPVDLVRMEEASPTLAERVREEGRQL